MRRVVADTNVLVSAIEFGGKPKQLLDLAIDGHIVLAISEPILDETLRVLRDKFHRAPEELRETEKQLRVIASTVAPAGSISAVDADPSDNRILECAIAADAEVIVSGDGHLLALGTFRRIRFSAWASSSQPSRNGNNLGREYRVGAGFGRASDATLLALVRLDVLHAQQVPLPLPGFDDLSVDEKIDYLQLLWDRIAGNGESSMTA